MAQKHREAKDEAYVRRAHGETKPSHSTSFAVPRTGIDAIKQLIGVHLLGRSKQNNFVLSLYAAEKSEQVRAETHVDLVGHVMEINGKGQIGVLNGFYCTVYQRFV